MGKIMGFIYIATVPDESLGSAWWVRRVPGLTLSLLHKSRGTRGLAAKSLYYYTVSVQLNIGGTDLNTGSQLGSGLGL